MNHTAKQLIALMLALAMSVSLCVTVFAESVSDLEPAEQEISEIVEETEEAAEEQPEEPVEEELPVYEAATLAEEVPELYFGSDKVTSTELDSAIKSALGLSALTSLRITGEGQDKQTIAEHVISGFTLVDGATYLVEKGDTKLQGWKPVTTWTQVGSFVFKVGILSSITLQNGEVVLPYTEAGKLDADALRTAIFEAVYVESTPELTPADVTIKFSETGLAYRDLSEMDKALGGDCYIQVAFEGKELYTAAAATAKLILKDAREAASLTLADTVEVTLTYAGEHVDYDALKRQIFEKALVESTPELDFEDVTFTYSLLGDDIPFEGKTFLGKDYAPIDTDFGKADSRTVKVSFAGNSQYKPCYANVKITMPQDTREESTLVLKNGVSIRFDSVEAMEQALFENLINWDNSALPEKSSLTAESFTFEYASKDVLNLLDQLVGGNEEIKKLISAALPDNYLPLEGGALDLSAIKLGTVPLPRMGAGDHDIRVKFNGNDQFKGSAAVTAKVTVNKGKLTLKVNSASIIYSKPLNLPANLVEVSDKQAEIITVYAGATSDIALAFFVDMPDTLLESTGLLDQVEGLLSKVEIAEIQELLERLKNLEEEGITVGELRKITQNDTLLKLLDLVGYDTTYLRALVNFFEGIGSIADGTRIGFSVPERAGLYNVTAISADRNYEAATATGTLLIRMNTSGNKLAWNSSISGKQLTVSQAAAFDFSAKMTNGGVAVPTSNVRYLYTGLTKKFRLYSSSKAPKEPGSYVVTAYVLGGNYLAAPITRSFKIVAG